MGACKLWSAPCRNAESSRVGKDLYCPKHQGRGRMGGCHAGFATKSLMAIIQHLTGQAPREPAVARQITPQNQCWIWRGARTRTRKTRLGNCRSGSSSCVFGGPTWVGKSMMAARMASILPPKRDGGVRDIHDPIRCGIVGVRRHSIHTPLSRTPSPRQWPQLSAVAKAQSQGNFTGA